MAKIVYAYIRPLGMTVAEVKDAARRWGLTDKQLNEEFSEALHIDVAPKRKPKAGVDHAPFRTELLTRNLRPEHKDIVGFPREDMAGKDEADVERVLGEILGKGFPVHFISSGVTISPHPEAKKQREALDRARRFFKASRIKARMDGKRRSGNMGGRKPRYTDAERLAVLPIWVEPGHGSSKERALLAGAMIGRDRVPPANMARWFDCLHGAGQVGPNAEVKPPKREGAKPKPKAKPKRKVSRGKAR